MKGSILLLLIAVALVYKANALPYSSTLQKDGYHYKESNSEELGELNQESLPFEATKNVDYTGSVNQVHQQNLNIHSDDDEGYYYEKQQSGNPFFNKNQESGCTSSSCVASTTFGLKKGNANMKAKDQRNDINRQGNPFFSQASASASVGISSHLPKAPTYPAPKPTRPVSVNIDKNNPFLKPGSGSAVLTPLSVQTDQQVESKFPDQLANGPDSYEVPNSPDQFTQQVFETTDNLALNCASQNKICVPKNHCINGYTTQQRYKDQSQHCDLNRQVCCTLKIQENEIKTSQSIPVKGNKANANTGGLFDLDDLSTEGKVISESNGYLPPIGGEPSDHIPAFSKPPEDPEHEGEANDASPVEIRPTFPPAPEIPPQVGCAAALLCVEEQFCTMDAVISPEPVALTSDQILRRAPMTSCRNPESGIIGKCCRDPNYVDPWPTGNLPANYSGGFDEMGFPTFLNIAKTKPKGVRPQESKNNQQLIRPQQPVRPHQPIKVQPIKTQPLRPQAPLIAEPVFPQETTSPHQPIQPQPIHPQAPFTSKPVLPQQPVRPHQPIRTQPLHPQAPFIPEPVFPQQPIKTQPIHTQAPIAPEPVRPFVQFSPEPIRPQQPIKVEPIRPHRPSLEQPIQPQTPIVEQPLIIETIEKEQPQQILELQPPFHSEEPSNNEHVIQAFEPFQPALPAKPQTPIKGHSPVKGHQPIKSTVPIKSVSPSKPFSFSHQPAIPTPPSVQQISDSNPNVLPNLPSDNFSSIPSVSQPSLPIFNQNHETQSTHEKPVIIKPHTPGFQCGVKNQVQRPSSLSDVDVAFGEIPWQAMILSGRDRKLLCSGAIVSPTVVLTAAHCVDGFKASDISIKAGEWKLGYDLKHEEPLDFEIVQVVTIAPHPGYSSGKPSYDTALLFLEHPIALDQHVDTICLGDRPAITAERKCFATGWGKIVLQVNVAGALMHSVDVDLLSQNDCSQRLSVAETYLDIDDSLVCGKAHHVSNNMCQVDVGGPLACDRGDGHYELTGIYSQDTGCLPTNQVATFALIDTQWVQEMMQSPPLEKIEQTFAEVPSTFYPKPISPLVSTPEPFQLQKVEPLKESFQHQSFQPVRQPVEPAQPFTPQIGQPFAKYGPPIAEPNQPPRRPVTPVAPLAVPSKNVAPFALPNKPVAPFVAPSKPVAPFVAPSKPVAPFVAPSRPVTPFVGPSRPVAPFEAPRKPVAPFEAPRKPVAPFVAPSKPVAPFVAQPVAQFVVPSKPVAPIAVPSKPAKVPIAGPSVPPQSEISPPAFIHQPSGFQHSHKPEEFCDCRQSNFPPALNQYLPPTL